MTEDLDDKSTAAAAGSILSYFALINLGDDASWGKESTTEQEKSTPLTAATYVLQEHNQTSVQRSFYKPDVDALNQKSNPKMVKPKIWPVDLCQM